jgi:probable HAF family extracellular repeat protein
MGTAATKHRVGIETSAALPILVKTKSSFYYLSTPVFAESAMLLVLLRRSRFMKHLRAFVAVLAGLLCSQHLTAQQYRVTNLGNLGYPVTTAQGINDSGEVVGTGEITNSLKLRRAFIWTTLGGMQSLGTLKNDYGEYSGGNSISSEGLVGGFTTVYDGRETDVFLWSSTGGMQDLGYGSGFGVNDSGEVVGYVTSGIGRTYAWSWPLRLNIAGYTETTAVGVNDGGFIVGSGVGVRTGLQEALLWTPSNEIFPLGTLPGGRRSQAFAITSNNIVVGSSKTADGTTHAFLWTRASGMQDLGLLSGFTSCVAKAVNVSGAVVGQCTPASGVSHGFIWTSESGMQDLNLLVKNTSYGTITTANGINASGQIVCNAGTGNPEYALILNPE